MQRSFVFVFSCLRWELGHWFYSTRRRNLLMTLSRWAKRGTNPTVMDRQAILITKSFSFSSSRLFLDDVSWILSTVILVHALTMSILLMVNSLLRDDLSSLNWWILLYALYAGIIIDSRRGVPVTGSSFPPPPPPPYLLHPYGNATRDDSLSRSRRTTPQSFSFRRVRMGVPKGDRKDVRGVKENQSIQLTAFVPMWCTKFERNGVFGNGMASNACHLYRTGENNWLQMGFDLSWCSRRRSISYFDPIDRDGSID